jgi:hypothetical protein
MLKAAMLPINTHQEWPKILHYTDILYGKNIRNMYSINNTKYETTAK